MHHDGMYHFPIDGASEGGPLVLNHENVEPRFLHAAGSKGPPFDADQVSTSEGKRADDEVPKELHAHGISVYVSRSVGPPGRPTAPGPSCRTRVTAASTD